MGELLCTSDRMLYCSHYLFSLLWWWGCGCGDIK